MKIQFIPGMVACILHHWDTLILAIPIIKTSVLRLLEDRLVRKDLIALRFMLDLIQKKSISISGSDFNSSQEICFFYASKYYFETTLEFEYDGSGSLHYYSDNEKGVLKTSSKKTIKSRYIMGAMRGYQSSSKFKAKFYSKDTTNSYFYVINVSEGSIDHKNLEYISAKKVLSTGAILGIIFGSIICTVLICLIIAYILSLHKGETECCCSENNDNDLLNLSIINEIKEHKTKDPIISKEKAIYEKENSFTSSISSVSVPSKQVQAQTPMKEDKEDEEKISESTHNNVLQDIEGNAIQLNPDEDW